MSKETEELDKLSPSPHGRGGSVHEEIPVAIRGYRCYIDRKIAELVKNLNEFTTKDGRIANVILILHL